ncbi:unnamed protein product, partial [marine sediment metagenome]
ALSLSTKPKQRSLLDKIREAVEILLPVGHDAADRVSERAAKLIATAYEKDRTVFFGRKPSGIMASVIYLAARMEEGVSISQSKVAEALGITVVTLRTGALQINELLGLGVTRFSDRRERYVCPFCGEAFTSLDDLQIHLWRKKVKYASTLRVGMFNEDGVLVNLEILEKMRKYVSRGRPGPISGCT